MRKLLLAFLIFALNFTGLFAASKYYTGSKGSNLVLAIPEARGVNLPKDQEYFQILIQTQLTDTIKKFSPIMVVDRQNEDIIDSEIARSEDGSYSDNDYIEFGKKVNAKYVLIAQIINTDQSYNFSARINETETNTTKYNYSDSKISARTIKNGMAVNMAVKDLLSQIGVELTQEGLKTINGGVDENTLKAQENLSKGINASKRGTTVEALQYYYAAAEYNVDNSEINARLNAIQSAVASGNLGDQARGEDEAYEYWTKTLSEADEYFTFNPPFAIIYSTKLNRLNRTSDELKNKENTLAFQLGLIASNNSRNTIKALLKGVDNSPAVIRDAIEWPRYSMVTGNYNAWLYAENCSVTVQLLNDVDKVIGEKTFSLQLAGPSLTDSRFTLITDLNELKTVQISNIKSEDITDNITIRIKDVYWNNINISTDNIRIATVEELKKQSDAMKAKNSRIEKNETKRDFSFDDLDDSDSDEIRSVPTEKELKKKHKRQRKALNKRNALYTTYDFVIGDYEDASGVVVGYDHSLLGSLFWGFNAGVYYDPFFYDFNSAVFMGEIGLSIGLSPESELYYKYGKGFALGLYPCGFGPITRHSFGYDWACFEFEYSFDIGDSGLSSSRLSVGIVMNSSWFNN